MLGVMGLNQDLARRLFPPRSSSDLNQQLGQPLWSAKIGAEEPAVAVDHDHQLNAGEMMSFGKHLRP